MKNVGILFDAHTMELFFWYSRKALDGLWALRLTGDGWLRVNLAQFEILALFLFKKRCFY